MAYAGHEDYVQLTEQAEVIERLPAAEAVTFEAVVTLNTASAVTPQPGGPPPSMQPQPSGGYPTTYPTVGPPPSSYAPPPSEVKPGVPLDLNGDGKPDAMGYDTTGDGKVDTIKLIGSAMPSA